MRVRPAVLRLTALASLLIAVAGVAAPTAAAAPLGAFGPGSSDPMRRRACRRAYWLMSRTSRSAGVGRVGRRLRPLQPRSPPRRRVV